MTKQFKEWWKKAQGKPFDARLGAAAERIAWAGWKAGKLATLVLGLLAYAWSASAQTTINESWTQGGNPVAQSPCASNHFDCTVHFGVDGFMYDIENNFGHGPYVNWQSSAVQFKGGAEPYQQVTNPDGSVTQTYPFKNLPSTGTVGFASGTYAITVFESRNVWYIHSAQLSATVFPQQQNELTLDGTHSLPESACKVQASNFLYCSQMGNVTINGTVYEASLSAVDILGLYQNPESSTVDVSTFGSFNLQNVNTGVTTTMHPFNSGTYVYRHLTVTFSGAFPGQVDLDLLRTVQPPPCGRFGCAVVWTAKNVVFTQQ